MRYTLSTHCLLADHLGQILDLETIAYTLIRNFGTRTGRKPERLLFYRDGVSEGQFDEICRVEIAAIKRTSVTSVKAC